VVEFVIEDTGIGINEKDLKALFKMFKKLSAKEDNRTTGIGLGLTISMRLAELLGGTIRVES
jgi:signal transduction histidine kinase